jgi:uncharacterized membrane protein (DUF4010 family)
LSSLLNLEPWWRFAVALLIGALIGLEREFVQQRTGEDDFAGIRTFALMSLLGAIGAYLVEDYGLLPFLAAYIGIILMVWASYLGEIVRKHEEGITTEVAAISVPLLGALVVWGEFELASALGVIIALVLALKPTLRNLTSSMSAGDLRAILEFLLITAVVLPLLPNSNFGPFNVINPYQIWLLVVLVSGIGFFGYVLIKILGAEQGVGVTGVLGGLVSSTATTVSFSGRSKSNPELSSILAQGILLTSSVMFPRIIVEVAIVYTPLLPVIVIPLVAMLCANLGLVFYLWRRRNIRDQEERKPVEVSNPLRLPTAITFALAFVVVLIVVQWANEAFGEAGVYVASALSGVTDVDAITLSVSELASSSQMEAQVAGFAIVLAALVNTVAKAVMAWSLGSGELRKTIVRGFSLIVVTGLLSSLIIFVFAS